MLFGKAPYDYKDRFPSNTNLVPAYESTSSVDPLSAYTSDDFSNFLEDTEDVNLTAITNTLNVGIDRIPAKNVEEAKAVVDEVMDCHSPPACGPGHEGGRLHHRRQKNKNPRPDNKYRWQPFH